MAVIHTGKHQYGQRSEKNTGPRTLLLVKTCKWEERKIHLNAMILLILIPLITYEKTAFKNTIQYSISCVN